ncbi:MAG: beta-ketoacyl-[acyl-carrier-protein] synthase family protein [Planctomycetes bacterium]|nr:beta-ketoacyl-[acyl-carrier-protein] synthase family protein [Planctomycetota bacterium]
MNTRRVVITGIGVASAAGLGREAYWQGLRQGRSGIAPPSSLDLGEFPARLVAEVKGFDPRKLVAQRKAVKVMCREIQLAAGSAQLALEDAALEGQLDPDRTGVSFGAGLIASNIDELGAAFTCALDEENQFDLQRFGREGMANLFPLWLLKYLPNMHACHISIFYDCRGPNNSVTAGDCSATLAIGEAARIITRGSADVFLAGGADGKITPLNLLRYELLGWLSHRQSETPSPFDRRRDGFVVGEGAVCLVLEELAYARRRGARILGEIVGFGSAWEPGEIRQHSRGGGELAMLSALEDAGVGPENVDVVYAHGLGLPETDAAEARAIRKVFGSTNARPLVTALKPMTGHVSAAAGGLEVAACCLALTEGVVPATLHCREPDPECAVNLVTGGAAQAEVALAMVNTFSFGGQSAALLVGGPPK